MLTFIIRRLLLIIPVGLGVTFVVFSMIHLTPGDPARIIAGEAAGQEVVESIRENLGLNDPFLVQYGRYLYNLVRGDMGTSIRTQRPVFNEIFDTRFAITYQLALSATSLSVLMGMIIGIIQATNKNSFVDTGLMLITLAGMSIPVFWLGILLINFFAVGLQILPVAGWGSFGQAVMPTLALAIGASAIVARMTRASLIEALDQDYVRTAYAKGISEARVVYKHALKNALIPVITVVGLQFGGLLAGAILTETIFAINGMGRLVVDAIRNHDFPVAQGVILIFSMSFIVVNCIVDLLYRFVNKRIDVS